MSKKEELEKLEEEIKIKELKLKKQELDKNLGEEEEKKPKKSMGCLARIFWIIAIIIGLLWFFWEDIDTSTTSNEPKSYNGCDGLQDLIDDGQFRSDSLAILQIQSQINMMSENQCQGLIDKNNSLN